jgi:hypothetical protein
MKGVLQYALKLHLSKGPTVVIMVEGGLENREEVNLLLGLLMEHERLRQAANAVAPSDIDLIEGEEDPGGTRH